MPRLEATVSILHHSVGSGCIRSLHLQFLQLYWFKDPLTAVARIYLFPHNPVSMADDESSPSYTARNTESRSATQELIKALVKPQSQIINVQLDESNLLLWKFQIETAIKGYGLEDYVHGTLITPPRFVTDKDGKLVSNQDFISHQRQDSLVSSWLLSTLSSNLLPQLIGCKSANEIWSTIEQVFNTQSTAKVMFYKRQL